MLFLERAEHQKLKNLKSPEAEKCSAFPSAFAIYPVGTKTCQGTASAVPIKTAPKALPCCRRPRWSSKNATGNLIAGVCEANAIRIFAALPFVTALSGAIRLALLLAGLISRSPFR
jgi:hypothetical protein